MYPQSRAQTVVRSAEIASMQIERFWPFRASDQRDPSLLYLGGLYLWSENSAFGGLSGLEHLGDGRYIAVTDRGSYLVFDLVTSKDRPIGIQGATIGPLALRRPQGGRLIDAEDIVRIPGSTPAGDRFAVALERRSSPLRRFRLAGDGLVEESIVRFPADAGCGHNRAIESVALAPPDSPAAGRLVIVAERPHGSGQHIPGWIQDLGRFHIRRHNDFDVTAIRFLSDGDLILLERRFRLTGGIALRIRRIPGTALRVDALLDGEILLDAGLTEPIDNMEGLAVHQDERGVVLTLISDDNFIPLQRTVLLQFRLPDRENVGQRSPTAAIGDQTTGQNRGP